MWRLETDQDQCNTATAKARPSRIAVPQGAFTITDVRPHGSNARAGSCHKAHSTITYGGLWWNQFNLNILIARLQRTRLHEVRHRDPGRVR